MKPILININDMSDSKEVYDSKPNIFFTLFIYLILGILATVYIWMYFGHIDVVVKSEGMLRPNNQVATIANTYGGTLESVHIEDGSYVKEGDILYTIEHKDLLSQLSFLNKQLSDTELTLTLLDKYKTSVEDGVNHFEDNPEEEEYYLKFLGYYISYETMENDYTYNNKERELNISSVTYQLNVLQDKLNHTLTLKKAISQNKNLFSVRGEELDYYNLYLKYTSDYEALVEKYKTAKTEIDLSTTEEGLVNSYDYYTSILEGLESLTESIEAGNNLFETTNSYSLQYEEYISKNAELTSTYEQAKENYEINKELEGLAVTEWEVEQSKVTMEEADRAIDAYKVSFTASITSNITEAKKKRDEIKLAKENTLKKDVLYEQNKKDRIAAITNYKLKYIVELDSTIATLKENMETLEANKSNLELQGEKNYIVQDQDNEQGSIIEYKNSELSTTINSINTYTDQKTELEASIDKLNTQIDSAVVKATKSGVINSSLELVEGDVLPSGTEVLSIIPEENSEYKVNIYVSNADIGKLSEGMEVKFNVYALPNSEYGYLTGEITKISKDLKVDANNNSGYYLVEADLDSKTLYDAQGEEAELKVGMACQAQMITESKRILTYVLEKIDLWVE